jgi:hypothetical protein
MGWCFATTAALASASTYNLITGNQFHLCTFMNSTGLRFQFRPESKQSQFV